MIGRLFEELRVVRLAWARSDSQRCSRQVLSALEIDFAGDLVLSRVETGEASVVEVLRDALSQVDFCVFEIARRLCSIAAELEG